MKYVTTVLMSVVALTFLATPATADWNTGDTFKMHFPQLPDLTPDGLDVLASPTTIFVNDQQIPVQKVVADDFLCTESGPITDIHIWGSWLEDRFPGDPQNPTLEPNPGNVKFKLSIHADIPKSPTSPSMPAQPPLWERSFAPGEFTWRRWAADTNEWFYDPNIGGTAGLVGHDSNVIQYNFLIPAAEAFPQERGKVYWLDVTAYPNQVAGVAPPLFGWKTSLEGWNDDAVFWDVLPTGGVTNASELFHPITGQSLNMAFVITPEPGTVVMLIGAGLIGLVAYARRRRNR
jgi:hypothetical protein